MKDDQSEVTEENFDFFGQKEKKRPRVLAQPRDSFSPKNPKMNYIGHSNGIAADLGSRDAELWVRAMKYPHLY